MRQILRLVACVLLLSSFTFCTLIAAMGDTCEDGYNERLASLQHEYNECMVSSFGDPAFMSLCYAGYESGKGHALVAYYLCKGWFWLTWY